MIDYTAITIFTLEAHPSTTAHSATSADETDTTQPTLAEFESSQCVYEFCKTADKQLIQAEVELTPNKELLVQCMLIGVALQKFVPQLPIQRLVNLSYYSPPSGHLGQCRMYETI